MNQTELSNFLDDVLEELQYRITEGIINLNKPSHKSILSEILHEHGQSQLLYPITQLLTEAPNDELKDTDFVHVGGPAYVHNSDFDAKTGKSKEGAKHFKKTEAGQFVPMSEDEYNDVKTDQGDAGGSNNNPQSKPKTGEPADAETAGDGEEQAEPETGTSLKDPEYQKYIKTFSSENDDISKDGLYSVGGGYYSTKKNGPAEFIRTEQMLRFVREAIMNEKTIKANVDGGRPGKFKELTKENSDNISDT